MTCTRRLRSQSTSAASGGKETVRRWRRDSMSGVACSIASATMERISCGALSSVTKPRVTRDMSSRSSSRWVMWATWRPIIWLVLRTRASSRLARCSNCAAEPIGASGFLSSCASIARNSSFRRSAILRSSCAARRSVTSRKKNAMPPSRERWARISIHASGRCCMDADVVEGPPSPMNSGSHSWTTDGVWPSGVQHAIEDGHAGGRLGSLPG